MELTAALAAPVAMVAQDSRPEVMPALAAMELLAVTAAMAVRVELDMDLYSKAVASLVVRVATAVMVEPAALVVLLVPEPRPGVPELRELAATVVMAVRAASGGR